jgi:leucyl aminopeptidase (aminopeptidase T)
MNRGGRDGRAFGTVGMGLNPNARVSGNLLESEKALGTIHIGFGDNAAYGGNVRCGVRVDALFTKATVEIDGKVILERGALTV